MPQLAESSKKRSWFRHTFEVQAKGKTVLRHTLLVNPQDMSVSEPSRTSIQQTLGAAYGSHFGQGLHAVTLSGLTGYSARLNGDRQMMDGYTEIKRIRNDLYRAFIKRQDPTREMMWYNWEDEEYYKIHPTSFRLMRSKSEPTLYRYEFTFTALEPIGKGTLPKGNYIPPKKEPPAHRPPLGAVRNVMRGIVRKTLKRMGES